MDVKLVLHKENGQSQICHLHREQTLVGRRRDCHLRILSPEVSRRHCLLNIHDGYVSVQDLDSVNGTFVNDQRVVGEQIVRPGDCLGIASIGFMVEYELSSSAQERLGQQARKAPAVEEEAEVLPVCEADVPDDAVVAIEELPVADEDTELAPEQEPKPRTASDPAASNDEPLPVIEDEPADWHLPQTGALRDLLSQIESSQSRPRRRER
jgi:predicted component of type VI protein secretion system